MTFRYSEDDPVWQEVAKRYQEILEREDKLLRTYPASFGQMTPVAEHTPPSVNALSAPGGDTNNKGQRYDEVGKKLRRPSRKSTKKQTYAKCIVIEEDHLDNGVTEDRGHKSLPKILKVYSLNSLKIQGEDTKTRKRKSAEDSSSSVNGESSKDVVQDGNSHIFRSWKKPCVVLDNFIDLTSDDDEETITCGSHSKAVDSSKQTGNVNARECESEREQSKEGANDRGIEAQTRKCDRNKREGDFVQEGNQGKRSSPTQQREQNDGKNSIDEGCDKSEIINNKNKDANNYNDSNKHKNQNCHPNAGGENETLQDEDNGNRGKTIKITLNEEKSNWKCGSLSSGKNNALNISYRENKITDLKARVAKQEEELAKLRTFKESKLVMDEDPQATVNHSTAAKSEQKENTKIELDNQKRETTVGMVNLEDICQHVIKSFDIFNARKRKDITVEKEGFNDFQVLDNNAFDVNNGSVSKQDEFLFQVGLRRKFSNHK